mgnify:CR=1 FL=1
MKTIKLILILLAFAGCKTVKESQVFKSKNQFENHNDISSKVESSSILVIEENNCDNSFSHDTSAVEITEVYYSKPDTNGVQYTERVVYRNEVHGKTKSNNIKKAKNTELQKQHEASLSDKSDSKFETSALAEKKVTEKQNSFFRGNVVFFPLAALLVFFIYSRFKPLNRLWRWVCRLTGKTV